MVALPGQLFTNTQIPACIWFLTKNKQARTATSGRELRDRSGEVLFIDARNLGYMKDRVLRDFSPEDLGKISDTLHQWQTVDTNVGWGDDCKDAGGRVTHGAVTEERTPTNEAQTTPDHTGNNVGLPNVTPTYETPKYEDEAGFCKSVKLADIQKHDYVLAPGRYVGAVAEDDDGEPFAEKMTRLTGQLKIQFEESERLEGEIRKNLAGLGYDI